MASNRGIMYMGTGEVEVKDIDFPKLVGPRNRKCEHGAILKQDEALKEKSKAAPDLQTCVKLAEDQGYQFTTAELQAGLSDLS